MNKQELIELIRSTEEGGGDTTGLKALLAEVESDERKRSAGGRPHSAAPPLSLQSREEEMTTQEYLEYKVGHLFPEGITGEVLEKLFEMDRDHSLKELKRMCVEAGLSASGQKKIMAAKLLARQRRMIVENKQVETDNRLESDNLEMPNQWEADPSEVMVIPDKYFEPLQYEVVVFGRREFTFQCVKFYPTEKETWTFDWVMMDTSTNDREHNITRQKMSYYPAMSLVNAAFMILPNPKGLSKEYGKRLLFKVTVFGKRETSFRCADYNQDEVGMWTFEGAVRDTSGRGPQITIRLVNAAFMVTPAPEGEA
jgi:hypothetical protein